MFEFMDIHVSIDGVFLYQKESWISWHYSQEPFTFMDIKNHSVVIVNWDLLILKSLY